MGEDQRRILRSHDSREGLREDSFTFRVAASKEMNQNKSEINKQRNKLKQKKLDITI